MKSGHGSAVSALFVFVCIFMSVYVSCMYIVCIECICLYFVGIECICLYKVCIKCICLYYVCIVCIACIACTCGGDGARAASAGAWSGSWWSPPSSESILRGLSFRPDSASESEKPGRQPSGRPRSSTRPDARGPRPDQPL